MRKSYIEKFDINLLNNSIYQIKNVITLSLITFINLNEI